MIQQTARPSEATSGMAPEAVIRRFAELGVQLTGVADDSRKVRVGDRSLSAKQRELLSARPVTVVFTTRKYARRCLLHDIERPGVCVPALKKSNPFKRLRKWRRCWHRHCTGEVKPTSRRAP